MTKHASDCSLHNEPAYPAGPCDCGAIPEDVMEMAKALFQQVAVAGLSVPECMERAIMAERQRCARIASKWAIAGSYEPNEIAAGIAAEIRKGEA